jgi:putative aldouronate transport system permease protein
VSFNTVFIALMKIVSDLAFPVLLALMLNEVRRGWFKKTVQTITFMPFFLSWVILAGILLDVFSPREGIVNQLLAAFGVEPVYFFGTPSIFPYMIVATNIWKEIGYNAIIVLAAITGIDPTLYEAAIVDGAKRIKQAVYVTVPSITPIVLLLAILSLANVLNAGFDQVFNLYSPSVYATGDILDTYVYRLGFSQGQYSLATAVGLFKSAISFVLIVISYRIANKYSDYHIF